MTRTTLLLARIQRALREAKRPDLAANTGLILAEASEIERDCCRRAAALKQMKDFLLQQGQDTYSLGTKIYKLKDFIVPKTWHHNLTIVEDTSLWNDLKRTMWSSLTYPRIVMAIDSSIIFYPAPTITGDTLKAVFLLLPKQDMTTDNEPEIDSEYDKALEYGTLGALLPESTYSEMYEGRLRDIRARHSKEISGGVSVHQSTIDDIWGG